MAKRFRDLSFQMPSGYSIRYRNAKGQFARPHSRSQLGIEIYRGPKRVYVSEQIKSWTRLYRDQEILRHLPKAPIIRAKNEQSFTNIETVWDVTPDFSLMRGKTIEIFIRFDDEEGNRHTRRIGFSVGEPRGKQRFQEMNSVALHRLLLSVMDSARFRISGKKWFPREDPRRKQSQAQNLEVTLRW